MSLVIDSKIGETSTTIGTGTYTLAGAISASWAPFTDIADGNTTWYLAEEDGVGWEVGTGTFTLSGTTLARTTILKSSNADAAVNWAAGTRNVYVVTPDFIVQYLADSGLGGDGTNTAAGTDAFTGGGGNNAASANCSFIPAGREATTRSLQCSGAFAGGKFSSRGDAQVTRMVLMRETTDGAVGKMTTDGAVGSILNMPVVPVSYAFLMSGKVLAWDSANDDRAAYDVEVLVYRDSGGTMALQYSNFTTIDGDDMVAWGGLTVTANNTNKAIELKCQGAAATTIHWVGNFDIIEIG